MKKINLWFLSLWVSQAVLITGCTSALWDKNTFAHYYRPASPPNLHLFYSNDHKDILVQYDERVDTDIQIHPRFYWLEPNNSRLEYQRKPRFVSAKQVQGLVPIPVTGGQLDPPPLGADGLYAVTRRDGDLFTLYLQEKRLERYKLPSYIGASQTLKQVLLTPFAVVIDATIVGAVLAYYWGPQMLSALNR